MLAEWIVYAEHPVEEVDQNFLLTLASLGVPVTVWRQADERPSRAVDGVRIIYRPTARADFYQELKRGPSCRAILVGPVTILPWHLPPSTRPVWLLSDQAYAPLINQLFPVLESVVVTSQHLRVAILAQRATFPAAQVLLTEDFVHNLKKNG